MTEGYPDAPWRIAGPALFVPALVDVDRLRPALPPGISVVLAARGLTLGGLVLASYEPGSTLVYRELIVCGGLVRRGARVGVWVSHILVDDERSREGGRAIWGLPKELAAFAGPEVRVGDQIIARATARRPQLRPRLPAIVPVITAKGWALPSGTVTVGPTRASVEIPPNSPLAGLLRTPVIGLAGRVDFRVPAPRHWG